MAVQDPVQQTSSNIEVLRIASRRPPAPNPLHVTGVFNEPVCHTQYSPEKSRLCLRASAKILHGHLPIVDYTSMIRIPLQKSSTRDPRLLTETL